MIPEKLTYLFVDFFTIIFPFVLSFSKWFDFKNYWKYFFPVNLFVAVVYIIWDCIFTYLKVWGFAHEYTIGISIFNLPLEEVLFFICTPYACVFTFYCFRKYVFHRIKFNLNQFWIIFAIIFLVIGVVNFSKLYTSGAFISLAITCMVAYKMRLIYFFHFLIYYIVILIPFFIFNGILTGSYLGRVVVYYNAQENLGIRLLTIPLEDVFYGMALLLFNLIGFEYLRKKANK